jgi:predicted lipoprotein with Yx(FWY)xxD motif
MRIAVLADRRTTRYPVRAVTMLVLAGAALSTAACDLTDLGSYRTQAAAAAPSTTPVPTPAITPAPVPEIAPIVLKPPTVLRAKAVRKIGTLVVDARGLTLYRSDRDSARPSRSRCTGACLKAWRPALVTGTDFTVVGIDQSLVGTIARGQGTRQLTLAGWPVYTFVQDRPGDVKGVCKAGFFPISPEGAKIIMRS